jgi:hypothetical protein
MTSLDCTVDGARRDHRRDADPRDFAAAVEAVPRSASDEPCRTRRLGRCDLRHG